MISCSNTNQMATLVSSLLLVFPRQSRSYCNAAKTRSSCMGSFVVVCFACLVSSTFLSWSLVNSLQVMVYLIVLSLSFFLLINHLSFYLSSIFFPILILIFSPVPFVMKKTMHVNISALLSVSLSYAPYIALSGTRTDGLLPMNNSNSGIRLGLCAYLKEFGC